MEKWLSGYTKSNDEIELSFSKSELSTKLWEIKRKGLIPLDKHRKV